MTDRALLQQALEALELLSRLPTDNALDYASNAIDALRERLAHCDRCGKKLGGEGDIHTCSPQERKPDHIVDATKMVPLSDEEIYKASTQAGMQEHYMGFHSGFIRFARAIEAAHDIKGEA